VAVAGAGFVPVLLGLLQGQFQLLPLLGITAALLALEAGHPRRASRWLLLGLMKPYLLLGVVLMLAVRRHWGVLVPFALGTAVIGIGSLGVLDNWLPAYVDLLAQMERAGAALGDYPAAMQNWRALVLLTTGAEAPLVVGALTVGSVAALVGIARRVP
jgi:hypothetical protein